MLWNYFFGEWGHVRFLVAMLHINVRLDRNQTVTFLLNIELPISTLDDDVFKKWIFDSNFPMDQICFEPVYEQYDIFSISADTDNHR